MRQTIRKKTTSLRPIKKLYRIMLPPRSAGFLQTKEMRHTGITLCQYEIKTVLLFRNGRAWWGPK